VRLRTASIVVLLLLSPFGIARAVDPIYSAYTYRLRESDGAVLAGGVRAHGVLPALDPRKLHRLAESGAWEPFFIAKGEEIFDFAVPGVGTRIAVLSGSRRTRARPRIVQVIDASGAEIASLDQVHSFAWSPAGDALVHVQGAYLACGGDGCDDTPFTSFGTWVLDVSSGRRQKVLPFGCSVRSAAE
jgi:hypothetical protein